MAIAAPGRPNPDAPTAFSLPRFRKEGDKLKMEYVCPLSQSHPHKLYFILRNICHIGDRYDDEFCAKFGAKRSYEPQVTPSIPRKR